jgi:hypothetical protein
MNDTVAVFNRYAAEYDHWFEEIAAAFEELAASLRRGIPGPVPALRTIPV